MEIKNWKLKQVEKQIKIVADDSSRFIQKKLHELNLPVSDGSKFGRDETQIDWDYLPHYTLFFDYNDNKQELINAFKSSRLNDTEKLIMTFGWQEPAIEIDTSLFINDWDDFFQSAKYQSCIFSEDYTLVMEVSRDYYLHSNFNIAE
jgi:hypothetical protein